ncbi:hypothetical protein L7F22_029813 [Adiantum nelumboides]|nr:hypothetical protein [Adiantum nelumboides]
MKGKKANGKKAAARIPSTAITTTTASNGAKTYTRGGPKVQIVQIFSPLVVKTDAANFRAMVQQLTGKDSIAHHRHHNYHRDHSQSLEEDERATLLLQEEAPSPSPILLAAAPVPPCDELCFYSSRVCSDEQPSIWDCLEDLVS